MSLLNRPLLSLLCEVCPRNAQCNFARKRARIFRDHSRHQRGSTTSNEAMVSSVPLLNSVSINLDHRLEGRIRTDA